MLKPREGFPSVTNTEIALVVAADASPATRRLAEVPSSARPPIHIRLFMDRRTGDLAVFNLPIDSKGTERPLTPGYGLGMESPVPIASEIEGPLVCFHDFRSVVAARLRAAAP